MSTASAKTPAAKPVAKSAKSAPKAEKSAPKPAVVSSPDLPVPTTDATTDAAGAPLKLKDLIARVAETTGAKKPQVKEIVEAALAEIGRALDKGEALNLPPFGRLKVNRSKSLGEGTLLSMKLKRGVTGKSGKNTVPEALAEDGEDS